MPRLLRCAFVLAAALGAAACAEPAPESAATSVDAVGKEVASDTTVIKYLSRADVKRRQGAFEARHPGWGVTRLGQFTGAIGAQSTATPGPQAPALAQDDYVYIAREFLIDDIDLHAFIPAELAMKTSGTYDPDVPMADVYSDGSGGHEVIFFATTHPTGFEMVESLSGSLAYSVHFGPDNVIDAVGTETGFLDTRGLPPGITIALPPTPGLAPNDPTTTVEVLGRTLSPWNDGWMTWLPIREVLASDIISIEPTIQKVPFAHGVRLTVAYHVRVHSPYVAQTDPTLQIINELHFIVDGANGDLLAEDDLGVQTALTTDMLDVRCTSSISFPGACAP